MVTVSLSSSPQTFSLYNNNNKSFLSLQSQHLSTTLSPVSSSFCFNPLRVSISYKETTTMIKKKKSSTVCYAAPLTTSNLRWISTVASAVLLLVKGTAVPKSFIVPLFALQAPESIISWIKGEYGMWAAFLALLVRLFFFIPGELELPLVALLLVIAAPYQVMNLRGTQPGAIISLVIAAYLAFQHFSRAGSLQKAFDQGSIVATLAIICITAFSCLLLI